MTGKFKTGMLAMIGFALTMTAALCLAQKRNHEQSPPAKHEAPQRQSRSPQSIPRHQREYRQAAPQYHPQYQYRQPYRQPTYAAPHNEIRSNPYSMDQRRIVARPPEYQGRPQSQASPYMMQQHREVPRPPANGQTFRQTPASSHEQRREVAHPPNQPSQPRAQGEASRYAPAQGRDVPRPPQAGGTQAGAPVQRAVPRPPQTGQPGHIGAWLESHRDLSLADQQKALQNQPQFRTLPPQQQQRLENRLKNFNNLPPQEQQRRLNRAEVWEHLTPQQKTQARQLAGQWNELAPQRRQMMKTAIGDLRAMPPDQRERVLDSPRFKGMFSDHERDMLRETTKLPLAPAQPGAPQE